VEVVAAGQVLLQDHLADLVAAAPVPWFRIQWVLQELGVKVMQAAEDFKEQIQEVVVEVVWPLLVVTVLME